MIRSLVRRATSLSKGKLIFIFAPEIFSFLFVSITSSEILLCKHKLIIIVLGIGEVPTCVTLIILLLNV